MECAQQGWRGRLRIVFHRQHHGVVFIALRSGDVLIAAGFASDSLPFWSQHVGYSWLFGVVVVQLLLLVFPRRFFSMPTRRVGRRKSEDDSGTDD